MLSTLLLIASLGASPPGSGDWQRLVGILQYLQADYPAAVESRSDFELQEQVMFAEDAVAIARELGPPGEAFLPRLTSVLDRARRAADPDGVSRDCGALVEDLVLAGGLSRSPRRRPDLARGGALYAQACAACHGVRGDGQTALTETMNPRPTSFLDAEVMDGLSPYRAFNTVSFGVPGTPMPEFSTLDEQDRWSLAFFVFTLRQPACDRRPPRLTLQTLATSTDEELVQRHGAAELPCLRRALPEVDEERALLTARDGVQQALELGAAGDARGARQALLDAYLEGIEPAEPRLRSRDPELVQALEEGFLAARLAAERASPELAGEGRKLLTLIDRARGAAGPAQGFWAVFWLAMLILLREGFEATVVIAALLAVLKKLEQPQHARTVHLGWMTALLAGAAAFFFARGLISGQNRELVEGVMALVAVGMLLYAALWLNARSNIRKFMGEIRSRMQGAIGRGSVAGLFAISFTAMFRESFETAVFLQGLSIDSPGGVAWGVAAGAVALLGLVLFIGRVGYRLPMKAMFNASTVLLVATAVVLLGKGLHALQETGLLPLWPLRLVKVDALGIYPDAYSALPQLGLALAPLLWLLIGHLVRQHQEKRRSKRGVSRLVEGP
jgi:high-affinity iron transporter